MKCKECSGTGKISDCDIEGMWIEECKNCHGSGYICTDIADNLDDRALLADAKVGDWVEVNVNGERKQGKLVRFCSADFMQDNHYAFALHDCFGKWYGYHRVSSITRKLKPSEVIVKIGCLSGTVIANKSFTYSDRDCFWLTSEFDSLLCSTIALGMLDTTTRELVESLLKAQEEI